MHVGRAVLSTPTIAIRLPLGKTGVVGLAGVDNGNVRFSFYVLE